MRAIRHNDPYSMQVVQLIEAAGLQEPCDLDLLLFFSRHPRVVLSSDQLATYVGYDVAQITRALEVLLRAGFMTRLLSPGATRRMSLMETAHTDEWLEPLRRLCATPDGRRALRSSLKAPRAQAQPLNGAPRHA
jgi:hypothetical protein